MKRKVYVIILIAIAMMSYNAYLSQKSTIMSDLLLVNVEALANDFEWDGDKWDSDDHWYNDTWGTSKWTPTLVECTVTYGVDAGLVYLVTVSGKKIVCSTGSGNCINGTSCSAG